MSSPTFRLSARRMLLAHGNVVENSTISFSGTQIISIEPIQPGVKDKVHLFVCSGFVDIHNHGIGGGNNVQEYWMSDESMYAAKDVLRRRPSDNGL